MNEENSSSPSTADQVGEAAGGITGAFAGAAIGATAGPIGSLLGGIAGAIGGWWSGRAIAEAAEDITEADEQYYRENFTRTAAQQADYDRVKAAYYLGDVAAANPEYSDRKFEEVEPVLERGWRARAAEYAEWQAVRPYASIGFNRGRERRRKPRSG